MKDEKRIMKDLTKKIAEKSPDIKGYSDDEELLNISLHDSYIVDIKAEKEKLIIAIMIDTYWFPGKPFGVLTLINPKGHEEFIESCDKNQDTGLTINGMEIRRKKFGGRTWPVVYADIMDGEGKIYEIKCSNFWFERLEKYENMDELSNNASYTFDMENFDTKK